MQSETIATGIVIAIIAGLMLWIIKAMIIPIWNTISATDIKKSMRFLLAIKYIAVFTAIICLVLYFPFNKWFVILISLVFSIAVIMFIYDYLSFILKGISIDVKKSNESKVKASHIVRIKFLTNQLPGLDKQIADKIQEEINQLLKQLR